MNSPGAHWEAGTVSQPRLASESGESCEACWLHNRTLSSEASRKGRQPLTGTPAASTTSGRGRPRVSSSDVGRRMLPRSIAVTAAAVCWASAWGQALPLLGFTTPRLTRDLPRTQGYGVGTPQAFLDVTPEVPREKQAWVGEGAPCWLQWDLHPGDWSASHRPLQCSEPICTFCASPVGLQGAESRDRADAPGS